VKCTCAMLSYLSGELRSVGISIIHIRPIPCLHSTFLSLPLLANKLCGTLLSFFSAAYLTNSPLCELQRAIAFTVSYRHCFQIDHYAAVLRCKRKVLSAAPRAQCVLFCKHCLLLPSIAILQDIMAFQWTEGVIIGIAVGGGCLLFGVVATIVMSMVRTKHRRLLTRIEANGERRPRRLSGIFNITDQDVARMPGTRASPRGSLQISHGRSPYTPMSSRDTFESRQPFTKPWKTPKSHQDNKVVDRSYPVPARLKRSSKKPKIKKQLQSIALSPITERHRSGGTASPVPKDTLRTVNPSPKDQTHSAATIEPAFTMGPDSAPNEILTPKPLFHSQRKLSYSKTPNTVPRMTGAGSDTAGLYTMDVKDPTPRPLEGPRPRSKSLHNRDSGLAPDYRPPSIPSQAPQLSMLPWERAKGALQRAKSQKSSKEKRLSEGSILSDSTSILDDEKPRGFSQVLSIRSPSPAIVEVSDNKLETLETSRTLCDSSGLQDRSMRQHATIAAMTRPQMRSQRSFQAEIQSSLPKGTSSGLPLNMSLHPPRKSDSATDPSKMAAAADLQPTLPKIKSADRKIVRRDSSPSVSLSRSTTFEIHDDSKYKRLSSPILQPMSGNRKSPISSPGTTIRSSIATETSYDWDLDNPLPVAKGRLSLHKRQNLAQIPVPVEVLEPKSKPSRLVDQEEMPLGSNPLPIIIKKERKTSADFRPPSTLVFDPQFANTPDSRSPKVERRSTSLAAIPRYEYHSSPEQEMYTPTRKPSDRRRHHHRYKSIIGHPGMTAWPFSSTTDSAFDLSAGVSDPSKPNIIRQSLHQFQQEGTDVDSRPSSFSIPSFPEPPPKSPVRCLHQPNWRGPKPPIRHPMGPRPMLSGASRIPVRHQSPLRGSSRRSPTRSAGVTKPRSHSPIKINSPSKMLNSISTLRRMNSEANTEVTVRGSKEHKRYQSIGDYYEQEAFGEGDVLGGGKENGRESARGPRAMPLIGYVEKVSTESSRYNLLHEGKIVGSYDEKGFLKEGSMSGFDF